MDLSAIIGLGFIFLALAILLYTYRAPVKNACLTAHKAAIYVAVLAYGLGIMLLIGFIRWLSELGNKWEKLFKD